jgi:hypothetical protein
LSLAVPESAAADGRQRYTENEAEHRIAPLGFARMTPDLCFVGFLKLQGIRSGMPAGWVYVSGTWATI